VSNLDFVLCTLGTRGDIAPFAAMARALRANGHRVTILSNAQWRDLARAADAEFEPIAPPDPPQNGRDDMRFFREHVLPSFKRSFDLMQELRAAGRRFVVVYRSNMLGAEAFAQLNNAIDVRVALQPSALPSVHAPPWPLSLIASIPAPEYLRHRIIDGVYAAGRAFSGYARHTRAFRRKLGLSARRTNASNAPILLLCPRWFATPPPDWPANLSCVGFPFWDDANPDEALEGFIRDNGAPIVFTPGTGINDPSSMRLMASAVCRRLRRPGVVLSPHASIADERDSIIVRPFADLSALLPHACAFVHHGGIGSTAQALRAGTPQLIFPGRFDQPDNAMRIARLGLGAAVMSRRASTTQVADLLSALIHDEGIIQRLRDVSRSVRARDAAKHAAATLETIASSFFPQRTAAALAGATSSETAQV
jgi:UDP:flavonoid glycosyltransferase YjiC (YdhE family)